MARVHAEHERVTVTVHGEPSAVLMSVEDLESMEETIALLADEEAMRELKIAEAEVARGEFVSAEELIAVVAERRKRSR